MGGPEAIRGYLLQTIISLLESLKEDEGWTNLELEPEEDSEKVDIKFQYSDEYYACLGNKMRILDTKPNNSNEFVETKVTVHKVIEKAILIETMINEKLWIPKNQIQNPTGLIEKEEYRIKISRYFYKSREMLYLDKLKKVKKSLNKVIREEKKKRNFTCIINIRKPKSIFQFYCRRHSRNAAHWNLHLFLNQHYDLTIGKSVHLSIVRVDTPFLPQFPLC
ncbi:hypothetical protein LCGC14_0603720 [marine sediment metagenome]|uniref:Uncharacterized protein n=1 Tax=marine sediment metagenome TaxID=412755 RepID=A0A0F9R9Z7_9ZZZZ